MIFRALSTKEAAFKKVTHVIFDMDGVLLDTEKVYDQAISSIAERYGKIYTPEIRARVVGRPGEESARAAVTEMALPMTVQGFYQEYKSIAYEVFAKKVDLIPGAVRLVRHFHQHKIPIAGATSTNKIGFRLKTKNHKELFDLFHHFVMGESDPDVKQGKPSPDIFLVCASRFKEKPPPEKCLVLEDSVNGVLAGVSAGMQVVMVPDKQIDPKIVQRSGATLILKAFEDFKPEVFGLPPFKET